MKHPVDQIPKGGQWQSLAARAKFILAYDLLVDEPLEE